MVDDNLVRKEFIPVVRRKRTLDQVQYRRQGQVQQEEEQYLNARNSADWNNWLDTRMAAALDRFNTEYSEAAVQLFFGRMTKHKKEAEEKINELKNEVAVLRGEVNVLRDMLKKDGGR